MAQKGTVKGTVKNAKGEVLANASVNVRGTTTSTKTDEAGNYTLQLPAGVYTIAVSYVGYDNIVSTVTVTDDATTELNPSLAVKSNDGEVRVVGSRSKYPRSLAASPAPVDIINVSQLANAVGQVDLNQILTFVAPSFQSAKQTISDGTDHVDPAQLRGLGTDQVLVLVNGKRRHQSALVNVNGTVNRGQVGTDMSTIPVSAIDRVEILRDGAAAQYGSDAIAGVINIVLKKKTNYVDANVSYGMNITSYDKNYAYNKLNFAPALPSSVKITDGQTLQAAVNYGFAVGRGTLNLTGEYNQHQITNRVGTYTGAVFANVNGVNKDDSIMGARGLNRNTFDMRIGNSQMKGVGTTYNFSLPSKDGKGEFYSFGTYSAKKGNGAGFYRYPTSVTGTAGSALFSNTVFSLYPNGFLPEIQSNIKDASIAVGYKTTVNDWNLDFSNTYGQNSFDFSVLKSVSYSQAATTTSPQTTFKAGGLLFTQNTINFDAAKKFKVLQGYNLAFGTEFRQEGFQVKNGEDASVIDYNGSAAPVAGSQVFAGFYSINSKKQLRQSVAFYNDNELELTKNWLLTGAMRLENYSDFGTAFNYKFSTRYKVVDNFNIRASTSTGFRAPSMQQRFYAKTSTLFVNNGSGLVPVEAGTFTNNSKPADILGIPKLKQETSVSYSGGFTTSLFKGFDLTVDAYTTTIKNRIVLTNNFTSGGDANLAAQLAAVGASTANFFTNAIDTKSTGVEMVASYSTKLGKDQTLRTTLAMTSIKNEVVKDANGQPIIKASPTLIATNQVGNYFNREDQSRIEVANPINKVALTFDYKYKNLSAMLRLVNFGKVTYLDPTINPNNPTAFPINAFTGARETLDQTFSAKTVTDLSVSYKITKEATFTLGANNLFDVYQDKHTHSGNVSLGRFIYSRRVQQMGFNGAYFFARLKVGLSTN